MMIEMWQAILLAILAAIIGCAYGAQWKQRPGAEFWRGHEAGVAKGRTERLPPRDDHGRFIKVRKGRK